MQGSTHGLRSQDAEPSQLRCLRVDRRQNRRFQLEAAKPIAARIAGEVLFQGVGVMTPDGLSALRQR